MESGYVKVEDKSLLLKDETVYRSLVGALLYIAVCARPDIAVSASILGRKVSAPTETDWVAAKRLVRYLKHTKNWKLEFGRSTDGLIGSTDADWAGDTATRRSTTGFVFHYAGGAVSWASRRQSCVTLSSMEAEYVALSEACQELVWLLELLKDLGVPHQGPVRVLEDNQSCIAFVASERINRRSKHIETRECYVKQLQDEGILKLEYCPTDTMVADVFTKPLGAVKQFKFAEMLGLSGCNDR
ncbi:uncharacterized protein LOC129753315 [Uranotaenia lowii]|uniref:uncharacterized protein LOC129753315 n=1 Tax=Uranotaenia lowii TaxID=190385 RepID=UPI00247A9AB4|nr:uncharacterized protein LOC129753315 [Uranotaenia lowii]